MDPLSGLIKSLTTPMLLIQTLQGLVPFNWQASEASETLSGLFNQESRYICILCIMCHSTYVTFALSPLAQDILNEKVGRKIPTGRQMR